MKARARMAVLVCAVVATALAPRPSAAGLEAVTVRQAAGDSAILDRDDGTRWRVMRGTDSLSAWRYGGRRILAFSPGPFLGSGSRLLIPELDQQCPVLRADRLPGRSAVTSSLDPDLESGLRAARQALELLGFDCGGTAERGWGEACRSSFLAYRMRKGLDLSPNGLQRALLALGIDAMGRNRGSGTSVRIATALSENRIAVARYLAGSGAPVGGLNCDIASTIREISEARDRITLVDGTAWALSGNDRERIATWTPADSVVACEWHLISLRNGLMVRASKAR